MGGGSGGGAAGSGMSAATALPAGGGVILGPRKRIIVMRCTRSPHGFRLCMKTSPGSALIDQSYGSRRIDIAWRRAEIFQLPENVEHYPGAVRAFPRHAIELPIVKGRDQAIAVSSFSDVEERSGVQLPLLVAF